MGQGVLIGQIVEGSSIDVAKFEGGRIGRPTHQGRVIHEDFQHGQITIETDDCHLYTLRLDGLKRLGQPTVLPQDSQP